MRNAAKVRFGMVVLWYGIMLVVLLPRAGSTIPQKISYQEYLTTSAGISLNG
jgi:hypothetical protein